MKKPEPSSEITEYAAMGMAAMLPGMIHARELLDRRIQEMQAQLAALQSGGGAKKQQQRDGTKIRAYWASMTPEERSAEMTRRSMVGRRHISPEGRANIAEAQRKRWAKTKDARVARASAAAKARWSKMTKKERSAEFKRNVGKKNADAALQKLKPANHPRDPQHPQHAAWIEKMKAAAKARVKRQKAAALPVAKLAVAS